MHHGCLHLTGKSITPEMPGACNRCGLYLNTCLQSLNGFRLVQNVTMIIAVTVYILMCVSGKENFYEESNKTLRKKCWHTADILSLVL